VAKIELIRGREILDSKGNPTLEVDLYLDDGSFGRASVPAGASKGLFEAAELRDGDPKRFRGLGVQKAVALVNGSLNQKLKGMEAEQEKIDQFLIELDGTKEKRNLGANTILGISLALARAIANSQKEPLYQYLAQLAGKPRKTKDDPFPTPFLVLINGGAHAKNNLDLQEFLIAPTQEVYSEKLRVAVEIFQALTIVLIEKAYALALGDEGSYGPDLPSNEEAIKVLLESIERAGYLPERDVVLGIDAAATYFWHPPRYILTNEQQTLTVEGMMNYYHRLTKLYPIKILEDPLGEEDWLGWQKITKEFQEKLVLIGDDLFVTNPERLKKGIKMGVANGIIIKPNQIGTLSETLNTIKVAEEAKYQIIVSHRSGETVDTFISDLAFAVGASYLKAGAPERGERIVKYNRLLEIQEELGRAS